MRLLCPNCGAQYEVDSAMIPDEGRDVQCSNCGKTWFQEPEEVDLGLAPAPRTPRADPDPAPPPATEPDPEPSPEDSDLARKASDLKAAIAAEAASAKPEPKPAADEEILGILREEAEREMDARRADGLETQTELGLTEGEDPETRRKGLRERMARLRSEEDPGEDGVIADTGNGARSELLPDIDEINSSLAPAEEDVASSTQVDPEVAEAARRSGFRIGFMLMMLIAILLVAAYSYAPVIARTVPASEPYVVIYVELANSARASIDEAMQRSAASLTNLIGESQ